MPANRPSATELLVAVRDYLEQDIKPLLVAGTAQAADDSTLKSLALNNAIAINLLKLLERETLLRAAQLDDEMTILREIITGGAVADNPDALNSALIELIESDDFVDADKRVLRLLQQISLSKLAIDNPSYSTLRKHRG